jgi:hypothetical protein
MLCSCNVGWRRICVLGSIDCEFLISGICGVTWYIIAYQVVDAPVWTPVIFCQKYIKFGRSEMGLGLYPPCLFLVFSMWHVGVSRCMGCSRAVGWWTPNIMVCCVRLPVVDGMGVFVVWWSVVFVFRIVDGTGMLWWTPNLWFVVSVFR